MTYTPHFDRATEISNLCMETADIGCPPARDAPQC